ncbi:glyoxalase/Bleomycin resistance protein/Dioxygenase superfamily protein [Asticcacaulis biprosthecium C19]|uniref:Glyoxalase/Bleomycin resistance protein/Dioxygenase superfamily protein n=1 Tax=Asticcacaulis biprosthecium C19 TaxID=715226 RepID=F4QNY4_9CAUL|nr:VOC family protein [Asticcacaulis biprosthecium]EGF91042.1 glyoxalase/Bleomycin resistance protein/Dioxygenase superfamily protein [Asticcacaulis biprosthecium C19]
MTFLNLVVLRAKDVARLGQFYEALGLSFVRERHGSGPEHLAATAGGMTLEIYPWAQGRGTEGLRIGFQVDDVEMRLAAALAQGATLVTAFKDGPWGPRAVVTDPEGHIVELAGAAS